MFLVFAKIDAKTHTELNKQSINVSKLSGIYIEKFNIGTDDFYTVNDLQASKKNTNKIINSFTIKKPQVTVLFTHIDFIPPKERVTQQLFYTQRT